MGHSEIENYLTNGLVTQENFAELALEIFHFQYSNCGIYRDFTDALRIRPETVKTISRIPFLPISFFKTHQIVSAPHTQHEAELTFLSSGTSGMETSKHFVLKKEIYDKNLLHNFMEFYGHPDQYIFIGLLPSYLERGQSSLVHMCHELMQAGAQQEDLFFLHDYEGLHNLLSRWPYDKQPFIIGVTYALLDFAESFPLDLSQAIIMETGGMKGRKEEMTREHIHSILTSAFCTPAIHSEYGMTELLSQAYSSADGIYQSPSTQKIIIRDPYDPLKVSDNGNGLINVIDLANLYSCSFIATEDIGAKYEDGRFKVLGRMDYSALRGCSLLSV